MPNNDFLDTTQSAELLGKKPSTLERWRVTGDGPVFYKVGHHVRYKREDLDAYIEAGRRVSTSKAA